MSKKTIKMTALMTLLLGVGLFSPVTAHAQSGYKITSTQDVTPEPYHLAKNIKSRYSWDKTHTKKMTILNQLGNLSLYVTQKVTMAHNGQKSTYFHVADTYGWDMGYVPTNSLVKGANPADDERPVYQPEPHSPWTGTATVPVKTVTQKAFPKLNKQLGKARYYQTTKKLKIKVPFTPYLGMGVVKVSVSLPAGTVVDAYRYSNQMCINGTTLDQKILNPGYSQGLWAQTDGIAYTKAKFFKRVSHPAYLPKSISHGDLYLGGLSAIRHSYSTLTKQSVQITSNGYVEVHQNQPWGRPIEYTGKPKTSVKIKRTRIKGHTRYLYLAKPLTGFKTTTVRYHGKRQYRLAFVNQQKTYTVTIPSDDDKLPMSCYGVMSFGGKTFFTSYGQVFYDD